LESYLRERIAAAARDSIPAAALWRELSAQGFDAGERIVCQFVATFKPAPVHDQLVRFETAPEDQIQVDWIEFSRRKNASLYAFVATLGFSRAAYVGFVAGMQLATPLPCHAHCSHWFGVVPSRVLCDNMKTVVVERGALGPQQHRFQLGFLDFALRYGFAQQLCRPYWAKTKGKFERMIGYLRRSFYVPLVARLRQVGLTLDVITANAEVQRWLRDVADMRLHGTTGLQPGAQLVQERTSLQPLPAPYARLVRREPPAEPSQDVLRERFDHWPQALRHPLSVYDWLEGMATETLRTNASPRCADN
jgi:transposase